jgi:hypothetical protein
MYRRLKIPRPLSHILLSALKARGCGNKREIKNSAAENRISRVFCPDLNSKLEFDRVFDLKGGDAMI